jgi:hypothetical protein
MSYANRASYAASFNAFDISPSVAFSAALTAKRWRKCDFGGAIVATKPIGVIVRLLD